MAATDRQIKLKERWLKSIASLIEECTDPNGKDWLIQFYKDLQARDASKAYEVEKDYQKLPKRDRVEINEKVREKKANLTDEERERHREYMRKYRQKKKEKLC